MSTLVEESGFDDPEITSREGVHIQPSIEESIENEVKDGPLEDLFSEESYHSLLGCCASMRGVLRMRFELKRRTHSVSHLMGNVLKKRRFKRTR
jgi:hypothetical protein